MKKLHCCLLLGVLLLGAWPARAQVFIKPTGQKAIPVRVQKLRADVEIIGAFAVTKWQMQFQPEGIVPNLGDGAVYEFVCARPTDAKVTAFRVAQGSGALSGRVVEKTVAASRVTFPAAKDDPLLKSGLNASNSFRAAMYPLGGWNEITVSGTWVQVLNSSNNRAVYRLPLRALKGATTRLAELNVKVTVRDGALQNLSSNYNLPQKTQSGARVLTLGQKNYRVLRDLQINLARRSTPVAASLLIAPNAQKSGGHFALALTAPSALHNPQISFDGLNVTRTTLSKTATRAGETLLFSGVYEGAPQNVTVRLAAPELRRELKVAPVQNQTARGVWATLRINALAANAKANRTQIIQISREYSVASPFTAWLVVGDEDFKIYRRVLASGQLDPLVREWWLRVADGQENSARAVRLKTVIAQISKANGLSVEDELYMRLGRAYGYVLWQKYGTYDAENRKPATKRQAKTRIARLSNKMLAYLRVQKVPNPSRSIDWASPIYGGELRDLRTKIMNEYRKPHPDYEQLEKWEHRFATLYGSTERDPRLRLWKAHATAQDLETQLNDAEKSGDKTKLAQLEKARIANSKHAYFVNNIGDPPIYVSAPADAKQVVALMPDGQIKTLEYNGHQKRWEGNYDVPTSMREGDYAIQIIIVNADNSRRRYAMKFRVDTTPPTGSGKVLFSPNPAREKETPLRLEIEHGGDVARVTALLPWGEKVSLLPSTTHGHKFFALARAPREYSGKAINVTYILVDRAHNLTTIEAEAVSTPAP